MQTSLATYANQGVIVNYLDLNRIGDRVAANPAAFGLQSAGAVSAAGAAAGNSDLFLFYADNVHLTSAGFAIVGTYAVRQLQAPLQLAATTDLGLLAASSFSSTLGGRLDLSDARFGGGEGGRLRVFVGGDAARRDRPEAAANFGYDMDSFGIHGGVEYDSGGGLIVGAAGGISRSESDLQFDVGRSRVRAIQGGVYGGWAMGGFFVQGHAALGSLSYTIRRNGVIDAMTARPDGDVFSAGGEAGYLFDLGGLRLGPVVGLRYADVDVDAYTEQGDAALTLNVEGQGDTSFTGHAGIEARGSLDMGGLAVRPYLSAAIEQEFDGDARTIRYALTTAPGIVNRWNLPARSDEMYGRITARCEFHADRRGVVAGARHDLGQSGRGQRGIGFRRGSRGVLGGWIGAAAISAAPSPASAAGRCRRSPRARRGSGRGRRGERSRAPSAALRRASFRPSPNLGCRSSRRG